MLSLTHTLTHTLVRRLSTVPAPTAAVPDVPAFLAAIGRNTAEYAAAFPTWDALFTATSRDLKAAGVDVPARRYILHQRETFRRTAAVAPTPKPAKKHGGERKLNQYLAHKRILDRIHTAQQLKAFRKEATLREAQYARLERTHAAQGHSL